MHVARIEHLLRRYGSRIDELLDDDRRATRSWPSRCRAPTTTSAVEVRYAATHEGALHLDDVLTRRTRISIETFDRGPEAAAHAARLMAEVLGWDEAHHAPPRSSSTASASRPSGARRSSPTTAPPTSSAPPPRTSSPAGRGVGGDFPVGIPGPGVRRVMTPTTSRGAGAAGVRRARGVRSDAQIFATNNTAVITDPGDPRLKDNLKDFARQVERIIDEGGGEARGSELLDGVFFDGTPTTFERSRAFDVDRVSDDELHTIADTVRARFKQQSVLTFDQLPAGSQAVDGVLLDVPASARTRCARACWRTPRRASGCSAARSPRTSTCCWSPRSTTPSFARAFAKKIGGDVKRARVKLRQARVRRGPAAGAGRARHAGRLGRARRRDRAARARRAGSRSRSAARRSRSPRAKSTASASTPATATTRSPSPASAGSTLRAAGDRVRLPATSSRRRRDHDRDAAGAMRQRRRPVRHRHVPGQRRPADRTTAYGSEDDDQISFGAFGLLGPTFISSIDPCSTAT